MNLQPLFEAQKKLDEHIEKAKGLEGQNLLDKKILALQVELGELANDWRGFKYWSENQEPNMHELGLDEEGALTDKNPLLEEYVDCLHFILSIGNEIRFTSFGLIGKHQGFDNVTDNFLDVFNFVNYFYVKRDNSSLIYSLIFDSFLELGNALSFTTEQIEQAYFAKNEENHRRQENGY